MEIYIKLFEVLFPVFFVIGIGYYIGKKDKKFDTSFITSFANQHFPDVQRAIKEGEITKEDAVKYLNMGNRL